MKKYIFLLCAAFASLSSQAVDLWVWNGGKCTKMNVDSIYFSAPAVDEPINNPSGNPLYSRYDGSLALTVMGFSAGSANPTVTISEVTDGVAKISFSEFEASGATISDFTADEVVVTPNADGSYSLAEENFVASASLNGEFSDLQNCSVTGTVAADGSINLSVTFSVSNFPVKGNFTGNR